MIEAGANEVPEAKMIEAIFAAHEVNQEVIKFHRYDLAECGKRKSMHHKLCSARERICFRAIKRDRDTGRDGRSGIHR